MFFKHIHICNSFFFHNQYVELNIMKLSAPKNITWWIGLVLGVLGLIGFFGIVAFMESLAFWFALAGLALMLLATAIKKL